MIYTIFRIRALVDALGFFSTQEQDFQDFQDLQNYRIYKIIAVRRIAVYRDAKASPL